MSFVSNSVLLIKDADVIWYLGAPALTAQCVVRTLRDLTSQLTAE